MSKRHYLALLSFWTTFQLFAQREITVNDFTTDNKFIQREVYGINWMNDGQYFSALESNRIVKHNVTNSSSEVIVDCSLLTPQLQVASYMFSNDEKKILLLTSFASIYRRSYKGEYYVYDIQTKTVTHLSEGGKQSYATFSPDGSKVAFVRENNLYFVNLSSKQEVQVTNDGKFNEIINGSTDWVYEEEFSFVVGFYWSPTGEKLAYYRFDETAVKEYNMQVWGRTLYPKDYRFKYPKAGEANSTVEIWIYDLESKKKIKADLGSLVDTYVPRVKWTQDPNILSVRTLNRLQNDLKLFHTNATNGSSVVVLNQKSDTYIDLEFTDDLIYLDNRKQFLCSSEMDGFKHFYLYDIGGKPVRQLTSGNFEVSQFVGLDQKGNTLYYTSTEVSPLERHFYSITLDGKKKVKLSEGEGTHTINASEDCSYYIDQHSSSSQPLIVSLYRTKTNSRIEVLEANDDLKKSINEFQLVGKETFNFKTVDGTTLEGQLIKPKNFDTSKQYPVLIYQYSGPGSQNVSNSFGGSHFYFHQMLAQKGYVIAIIDTRGTGGRGEKFKKSTYKELGKSELEDHIAGTKFLSTLDYVDDSRIGIWGWSYGGYMSSLAMTKAAGVFKMGIAVSPVTNWRFYDTIYTERYLQTPQLNASGYDNNSPSTYAANLSGNFLLIHGTGDDNVHFQNSIVLEDALINAGKQFRSFYYPDKHHGIQGEKTHFHLYTMMADYILENL
ncbi:MAG TPA: S9 family peptidase [Chryseolinea sp.]|nr:S9 family peptidase [Chryseolinea sp.]